ncbi:MAG TPA: TetR/AcrR family transcriptional regulator [Gammaproteobacteria bacterium]|nr:TetR/AcrR family transcriptional regulator [Gammaproteobacteria bacterium]
MSDLRQRKAARTRLAIAGAMQRALQERALDAVPVKALCREAEISEATFFNYFPRKQDLLAYLAQLWLLELGWLARARPGGGLATVEALFARTAKHCTEHAGLMRELLAWLARGGQLAAGESLSALEKQLAFPELEGIGQVAVRGVDALVDEQLQAAVHRQELPPNTLVPALLAELLAILFGMPLVLLSSDPQRIAVLYQQQLQITWAGVRQLSGAARPAAATRG